MQINSNVTASRTKFPQFGSIVVTETGRKFLLDNSPKFIQYSNAYENIGKNWDLIIDKDYSLFCARTGKTYKGPFIAKRHFKRNQLLIQMKNNNGKTVSFAINMKDSSQISELYKLIKNSSGFQKMLLVLQTLEKKVHSENIINMYF